jgi:hypothetical protein
MSWFRVRIGLIACLLMCSPLLAEVKVTPALAVVKTRTFNPQKPPAEMPKLDANEAAVTQSKFACSVQLDVEISQVGSEKPIAKIAGVEVTPKLDVTIWLPGNVNKKIRAHEEGHRKISEAFYARAEQIARNLAEKYVGRAIDLPGVDAEQNKPIIQRVANEFCQEYLGKIEVPSEKAQESYDKLTDHGRNTMPENIAIERAMDETGLK